MEVSYLYTWLVVIQDGDHQRTESLQHRLVLREAAIGRKDGGENLHLWQRPTGGAAGVNIVNALTC